jgi:hypothetical protein
MKTSVRRSAVSKQHAYIPQSPLIRRALSALLWAERGVFFAIGVLLFLAALSLLLASSRTLIEMFVAGAQGGSMIVLGSRFLDVTLLVLMIVELAYTVILSLRGAVLLAEPFLIVGLIAVIRRMLVITVGEVGDKSGGTSTLGGNLSNSALELGILTLVVIAFVFSIFLLRQRPKPEGPDINDEEFLE